MKDYEKQEKRIKELKASGQSKKKAESKQKEALTRKQLKNQSKLSKQDDEDTVRENELLLYRLVFSCKGMDEIQPQEGNGFFEINSRPCNSVDNITLENSLAFITDAYSYL